VFKAVALKGIRMQKLTQEFYHKDAVTLAPLLLGKIICHKIGTETIKSRITETESYMQFDTACHAYRDKTKRNATLFEEGGIAYIYLCYGIHEMLNIVTGEKDNAQAVLIRGIEGFNGPGKLTKHLEIDRTLNGMDLCGDILWLEDDGAKLNYAATKRIGIDYADEIDKNRLWRFIATPPIA